MPTIYFIPRPAGSASYGFALDGVPPEGMNFRPPCLSWFVTAQRDGEIRLASGGTLERLRGDVSLFVGSATPEGKGRYGSDQENVAWGYLRHHAKYEEFPEGYSIDLYVSAHLFERLLNEARSGRLPILTLSVCNDQLLRRAAEVPPIKYGWEPDGSGLEWDNNKHEAVEIEWCEFTFRFPHVGVVTLTDESDGEEEKEQYEEAIRANLPVTKSDLDAMRSEISAQSRRILVPLWVVAALLAVFALFG